MSGCFDGTNNNMERDKPHSHSNIVSLYDAHIKDQETHFAYYLFGVGTPFREVGEMTESSTGKSFASGGSANSLGHASGSNAVHRVFHGGNMPDAHEMKILVTKVLSTHFRHATEEKELRRLLYGINRRLINAVRIRAPAYYPNAPVGIWLLLWRRRGARVFCNWRQGP